MQENDYYALAFMIFFIGFIMSGIFRFWNAPDDPRGQRLTLDQILSIFKKKSSDS